MITQIMNFNLRVYSSHNRRTFKCYGQHFPLSIKSLIFSGYCLSSILLLLGAELTLMVESFCFLSDLFPFPSIMDAGYPVFNLHLENILFNVIFPSVLESSL